MGTKIGFMTFIGILGGVVAGTYFPYPASYEAVAGGFIGFLLGLLLEKLTQKSD